MATKEDDRRLVERCLNNEPRAFDELLNRYKNQVFSLICRLVQNPSDAEDLAQETFIKAFRGLSSYDPAHPLLTWIFKIAHNAAIDFMRARKPGLVSIDDDDNPVDIEDSGRSIEKGIQTVLQKEMIERLLAAVPLPYREVLILRHQEELDYGQIAQILQIPEGTVKNRLFRARNILKKKLEAVGYAD